jgi:hypothetical protein
LEHLGGGWEWSDLAVTGMATAILIESKKKGLEPYLLSGSHIPYKYKEIEVKQPMRMES